MRFIALEGICYLTTIEPQDKILKIIAKEISSKNVNKAVMKRLKMHPRVRLNLQGMVEYPSLDENPELLEIL